MEKRVRRICVQSILSPVLTHSHRLCTRVTFYHHRYRRSTDTSSEKIEPTTTFSSVDEVIARGTVMGIATIFHYTNRATLSPISISDLQKTKKIVYQQIEPRKRSKVSSSNPSTGRINIGSVHSHIYLASWQETSFCSSDDSLMHIRRRRLPIGRRPITQNRTHKSSSRYDPFPLLITIEFPPCIF